MRLHELRILAVGPFVDEQVIDFERLGASGLFLLEGPTGVGKTTVLDAVTFALYGSVTGSASDSGRLRSDFADPGVAPRVQLELSVRGTRLRVTRTPEHERPKRRGTGMIKERPTAHLELWQDGTWVSRSTRQDEIGGFVGELLGLTRDQFRQVVLLPQGEFAGFLRADDDGRRAVLVKLFGTQFYERLAAALQRRASQARAAVTQSEASLAALMTVAWEAGGTAPEEDPERPLTWEQQVADLESISGVVEQRARLAAGAAAHARRAQDAAEVVATEAAELADRVAERDTLVAELHGLEVERCEQEERERRVDRARRSRPVRPLLALLGRAQTRLAQTASRLTQLGVSADSEGLAARARLLMDDAGAAERTAAGLAHIVELESGLGGLRARLGEAQTSLAEERECREGLQQRARELPGQRATLAAEIAEAQGLVEAAERAQQELVSARRRREAAREAVTLATRLEELREVERTARRRYDDARDHVALVVGQRLAGLQGELAARLVSGEACLVCGSVEHPAPAATDRSQVAEEVLREAEQALHDAVAAWEAASGSAANVDALRAAALAVADGIDPADAQARVSTLESRISAGTSALTSLGSLRQQEAGLTMAEEQVHEGLIRSATACATAQAQCDRLRLELDGSVARVEEHRGGHPTVAARCAALLAASRLARDEAEALAEHHQANEAVDAARRSALAAAQAAEFHDLDEARECVLDDAELRRIEERIRAWDARLGAVQARLAAERLQAVEALQATWVRRVASAAETLREEAAARGAAAADHASRAELTAEQFAQRLVAVRRAAAEHARVAADAAEIMAVDDYVRGNAGKPRMTLSTFVLRYWFEQVVAAANVRLQAMSNGKYELLRVERGARAASRVGLGLAVLDRHTGRERGTETLSGGETFYTSLSLALGLADVVVAEAGGAQLDTLFIDEGFGSLDSATLDEVMSVIDELRGHGRVVGVVSHVAELNERIAERLSIRRERPDGPSRVTVVA